MNWISLKVQYTTVKQKGVAESNYELGDPLKLAGV